MSDNQSVCSVALSGERLVQSEARLVRHGSRPRRSRDRSGAELCDRRLGLWQRQDHLTETAGDGAFVQPEPQRLDLGQRRRSLARRQLDRQDRIPLRQSRRSPGCLYPERRRAEPDHRHSRAYLPGRPQLPHRRQQQLPGGAASNWVGFYLGGNFGSGTARDRSSLTVNAGPIAPNGSI